MTKNRIENLTHENIREILRTLCLICDKLEIEDDKLEPMRALTKKLQPTKILEQIIEVEKDNDTV